jgi:hypothetical protein
MSGVDYYECSTLIDVFWRDVQTEVFGACDAHWGSYALECKLGAETFTLEKIGACFDVTQCSDLGAAAAAAVAGSFCKSNHLYHERPFLPSKCVTHAENGCKSSAVEEVQRLTDGGVCAADVVYANALDVADDIYALCHEEVYNMEQAARLPWY